MPFQSLTATSSEKNDANSITNTVPNVTHLTRVGYI